MSDLPVPIGGERRLDKAAAGAFSRNFGTIESVYGLGPDDYAFQIAVPITCVQDEGQMFPILPGDVQPVDPVVIQADVLIARDQTPDGTSHLMAALGNFTNRRLYEHQRTESLTVGLPIAPGDWLADDVDPNTPLTGICVSQVGDEPASMLVRSVEGDWSTLTVDAPADDTDGYHSAAYMGSFILTSSLTVYPDYMQRADNPSMLLRSFPLPPGI